MQYERINHNRRNTLLVKIIRSYDDMICGVDFFEEDSPGSAGVPPAELRLTGKGNLIGMHPMPINQLSLWRCLFACRRDAGAPGKVPVLRQHRRRAQSHLLFSDVIPFAQGLLRFKRYSRLASLAQ